MFNINAKMPVNLISGMTMLFFSAHSVAAPQGDYTNSTSSVQKTLAGQLQTAELEIVNNERVMSLPALSLPLQSAKLFSRIGGFINARYADIGDKVKKNELLATIDEPQIKAKENKILADIDEAQAELELSKLNYQRAEQLIANKLVSKSESDRLRIFTYQAQARIASLQAQLAENRINQSFLEIRAPFDGYVVARNLEVGDLVSADTTQPARHLFEIANTRRMRLNIHVPQNEVRYIATGDELSVTFTGYQNIKVKGHISRLSQTVNARTGTMLVEAEFDNRAYNLPAGLRGTASFNTSSDSNDSLVFKAPLSALSYHNGHDAVVGMNNGEIAFHHVEIVAKSQNSVLLSGELTDIGRVVLNPNALLLEGG